MCFSFHVFSCIVTGTRRLPYWPHHGLQDVLRYDSQTPQPKANYYDAIPQTWKKLSEATYRLGFQHSMPDNDVGDFVVVRSPSLRCMNVVQEALDVQSRGLLENRAFI